MKKKMKKNSIKWNLLVYVTLVIGTRNIILILNIY
jgi:hypothetical protein